MQESELARLQRLCREANTGRELSSEEMAFCERMFQSLRVKVEELARESDALLEILDELRAGPMGGS